MKIRFLTKKHDIAEVDADVVPLVGDYVALNRTGFRAPMRVASRAFVVKRAAVGDTLVAVLRVKRKKGGAATS